MELTSPCVGTVLTSGSIQGDDDTSAQRKHFVDHPPMRHGVQMLLCRLHNHRLLESFGLWLILDQRTHHLNASKLVTDGGVEFATIFAVINSNFLSRRAGCHSMVACNKWIWRALWKQSCSGSRLLCTGELGSQQTQARCMCSSVSHFPCGLVPRLSKIGGGEGLVHTLCTCT